MTNATTITQQKTKTTAAQVRAMALIEKQKKDLEQIQKKFQLSESMK